MGSRVAGFSVVHLSSVMCGYDINVATNASCADDKHIIYVAKVKLTVHVELLMLAGETKQHLLMLALPSQLQPQLVHKVLKLLLQHLALKIKRLLVYPYLHVFVATMMPCVHFYNLQSIQRVSHYLANACFN